MIKKKNVYLLAVAFFIGYLIFEFGSGVMGFFESISYLRPHRIIVVAITLIGLCFCVWRIRSQSLITSNVKINKIPSYEDARKECISDLENVINLGQEIGYNTGYRSYSAHQLKHELEQETLFGKEYVENYIDGLKFFSEKL